MTMRQRREFDDIDDRPVVVQDRPVDEGGTGLGVVLGVILAIVIAGALVWLVLAGRTPVTPSTAPNNSNNPTINVNPPSNIQPPNINVNPPANVPAPQAPQGNGSQSQGGNQ